MTTEDLVRRIAHPGDVGPGMLLGVCCSMKPPPGRSTRSAVRTLLDDLLRSVQGAYPNTALLDLREHPLPLFDGRRVDEHTDPSVALSASAVAQCGALVMAVPGYWSAASGVFKNFVEVLCGPAYDMPPPVHTVFRDKPTGILVVGADPESAAAASRQARTVLEATGARIVLEPVTMSNPRERDIDWHEISRQLMLLGAGLAREALLRAAHQP